MAILFLRKSSFGGLFTHMLVFGKSNNSSDMTAGMPWPILFNPIQSGKRQLAMVPVHPCTYPSDPASPIQWPDFQWIDGAGGHGKTTCKMGRQQGSIFQ